MQHHIFVVNGSRNGIAWFNCVEHRWIVNFVVHRHSIHPTFHFVAIHSQRTLGRVQSLHLAMEDIGPEARAMNRSGLLRKVPILRAVSINVG